MHKGIVGAENLNKELRSVLNPNPSSISIGFKTFAEQDKVMQITNNYDKKVYNGDIGRIIRIDKEEQKAIIRFDSNDVEFSFSELDEIIHAYAISIHKSQGSEYPAVIIPILTQHYILLQRNLLYTAITRGKKLVTIVGAKKAMAIGINNDKVKKRYTLFKKRLQN
jgi:exodeoxyribonuclease V alpha subunit